MKDNKGKLVFYKSLLVGGFAGATGAFIASPFYLIKTHLQSQASKEIAFGHQYHYKGTWSGLWGILKEQGVIQSVFIYQKVVDFVVGKGTISGWFFSSTTSFRGFHVAADVVRVL